MDWRAGLRRVREDLGITAVLACGKDVHLLLLTRFIRMFAYGSSTLILALYFAALGHSDTRIGLFMTLTLVGDVGISLALTFVADGLGRRRVLILGALMMTVSGVVFATLSNYWILLAAAMIGVISPSGNEIGPFRAVEESTLAHLSEARTRSDVFAWYVVVGTLGTSGGSLAGGWVTQALQMAGWTALSSFRLVFWIYAAIGLIKAGVSALLSPACEAGSPPRKTQPPTAAETSHEAADGEDAPFLASDSTPNNAPPPPPPPPKPAKKPSALAQISPASRLILLKLCGLFFFDSLASGMVPNSLVAFYLARKFSLPEGFLGSAMSSAQFLSSMGNIFASSVAKRIGLVRAMVYTHLPSAIMLGLIPAPSNIVFTLILLIGRSMLGSMDQAPRTAFLAAVVKPEERTAVMGVVNTVKTMSQSSGPLITGSLAQSGRFWIAFAMAGALKAGYDLGMLAMFVNMKLEGDVGRRKAGEQEEVERAESLAADEDSDASDVELEDLEHDDVKRDKREPAASS